MPFDLAPCKAASEKCSVHPQPFALSPGSRKSFWGTSSFWIGHRSCPSRFHPFLPSFLLTLIYFLFKPFHRLCFPTLLAFILSRMFLVTTLLFLFPPPPFLFAIFFSVLPHSMSSFHLFFPRIIFLGRGVLGADSRALQHYATHSMLGSVLSLAL